MKKISFILAALLVLVIFSCKKKEKDPEPTPTPTTPAVNNYDGLLSSTEFAVLNSGTITSTSGNNQGIFPTGGFYNSSTISDGFIGTALNVGTVSANSISLKAESQTPGIIYNDTTNTILNAPIVWSVSGGNSIPAFTYTYTGVRPTYTGWSSLQDTVKRSQTTVVNLNGITGADEIQVYVMTGANFATKVFSGTNTSVSFSPSELSSLAVSNFATLSVTCTKYSIVNISGKNFKFKIVYSLFKTIVTQ